MDAENAVYRDALKDILNKRGIMVYADEHALVQGNLLLCLPSTHLGSPSLGSRRRSLQKL